MKPATYDELLELIRKYDAEEAFGEYAADRDPELEGALENYFQDDRQFRTAVLGVDIYKYSRMEGSRQRVIPVVFRFLYKRTKELCLKKEEYLFQKETFEDAFISTGDGGFQILSTPLHAIAFAALFQLNVAAFNAFWEFPKIRSFVGPLTLRYALTLESLVRFDQNYYGPAVINNARILSKDRLNRFLLDGNAVEWFERKIGTLESLSALQITEIAELSDFKEYAREKLLEGLIFGKPGRASAIGEANIQKIGMIAAKESTMDVYNVQIQVRLSRKDEEKNLTKPVVVTLGNLNASGIAE